MKFQDIILIHYHEIGLKGKNRSTFEKKLKHNVDRLLKAAGVEFEQIRIISGRLAVVFSNGAEVTNVQNAFELIKNIPGVARVSKALKCQLSIDAMIEAGKVIMAQSGADHGSKNKLESFKVAARRNHTAFEVNSMQMNQLIGGALSDAFPDVKVQMKNPELQVSVEAIEGSAYVYGQSEPGVGGLPVGSSGRVVGLLSSGIDSPVAL